MFMTIFEDRLYLNICMQWLLVERQLVTDFEYYKLNNKSKTKFNETRLWKLVIKSNMEPYGIIFLFWKKQDSIELCCRMTITHLCQQCRSTFSKPNELIKHQRILKHRIEYEFSDCRKLFYSASNRDRYQQNQNDANQYQCYLGRRGFQYDWEF